MAKANKSTMKLIGLVLMVVGVGLAVWGYQMSGSIGSGISQALTGSPTDKVMITYICAAVSFVAGLFVFKR